MIMDACVLIDFIKVESQAHHREDRLAFCGPHSAAGRSQVSEMMIRALEHYGNSLTQTW
jgi:hypothetical protein